MQLRFRLLTLSLVAAFTVQGPLAFAAPKKGAAPAAKPAAKSDAKTEAPEAGEKKGEAKVQDTVDKRGFKKKKEVKKEERKGPAKFSADLQLDDVDKDAKADAKRDEQIKQLQKIIPKETGPDKAELLFRLAELWWAKSKFKLAQGIQKYDEALSKWMEKQNKGVDAGAEPQMNTFLREAELYRQEALRKYEEILKEFPNYDRLDEVLFAYAYNKYELGQKDDAMSKYAQLIKQFPTSKLVPDAYVQMGEHFFNTNQLVKARHAYEEANKSNNPKIKYFATYKLAWCDFNGGAYEDAIKKFKTVIECSASQQKETARACKGLKPEALNDSVVSFAQLDAVDEAISYYKKQTGKDDARRLIAKLGGQYQEAGKHDSAIRTYRQLIADDPDDPRAPDFQSAIITSYEGMRKRDMVAKEMRRLVELYGPSSPWAVKNKNNKGALDSAYEITENAMRTMVTEYHQEAQKTKAVETYKLARDIYADYLKNFGTSEFAYNLRYYYADILWALNEFDNAATQYLLVVDADAKGSYSKAAGYNAILCYEKLLAVERGEDKIEKLDDKGKIDEKKKKGTITKAKVALDRHDKDAKAEPLTKIEQNLVAALDKYTQNYSGGDDEITVRYKAAFLYYGKKHDVEAAKRFGDIIVKWPQDQWSRKAADLTLNILEQKEEWFELNRLAREFNGNKKLTSGDKEFATRLQEIVEGSQFKYVYDVLFVKEKKNEEAAAKFRDYVAEFPKSKYTPQAIVLAMDIHAEAKQLDLGIELGEKFMKEYPESKSVAGEELKPRVLWSLASLYEATSDFKSAAGYYEKYVDHYLGSPDKKDKKGAKKDEKKPAAVAKKDEKKDGDKDKKPEEKKPGFDGMAKVPDALYNAALWSEGLGNFEHAIALYTRYIAQYPNDKATPDLFLKIGLIYEQQKNLKDAAKVFKGYVDQYGKQVPPGRVYFAKYKEFLALKELKQDKDVQAAMNDLIQSYGKLPKEEQQKDDALTAYAHARFLALEPLWKEYTNVRFNKLATLKKDLKSKTELIQKVEKAYTEVAAIGGADWTLAAVTRIGMAYHDMAKNFRDSPDPPGLDEEQQAMYRGELENRAFPLEDKAIAAYEGALSKSFELKIYNEWTIEAQKSLNQLKTDAYGEIHEVAYEGAEFFATAPANTDAPQPPPRKEEPPPAAPATQPAGAGGF